MSEKVSNDLPRPSCNFQNLAGHFQYFVGRGFKPMTCSKLSSKTGFEDFGRRS
jgi:hypothetical protein